MDERIARAVMAAYPGRKMNVEDAKGVIRAWASQWTADRWGNYKPTETRRIKLTKRQVRREEKRGSQWRIIRSTPMVEAALNLVKKSAEVLGEEGVLQKVAGAKTKRAEVSGKRAQKAKQQQLHKEVMDMVAKVASSEMPVEFVALHDDGAASSEFQTRYNELISRIQALRRLGRPPRDQDMFSSFQPPLAPMVMDVSAEWVEKVRDVPYTVTVRPGGTNQAVIEIGTTAGDMSLGARIDPVTRSVSSMMDVGREGDAYLSGRIQRSSEGAFGALFFVISQEKQKGAGSRVLDLWCNLMDSYGAKAWVAEGIGDEGMAFLDAKVRDRRLEKIGGRDANLVFRCLGGPEGKQPTLPGVSLAPNPEEGEHSWDIREALKEWREARGVDHIALPPDDEPNPLYWIWKRYSGGGGYSLGDFHARTYAARKYAWAVPGPETIRTIAASGPILEVGSGRGYWAKMIADAGGDIIATDPYAPDTTFYPVEKMDAVEAVKRYGAGRVLLLVWPPAGMSVAFDALRAFEAVGGTRLIYVGEDGGGCVGDASFHAALGDWVGAQNAPNVENRGWELVSYDPELPNWGGFHDAAYYYERSVQPAMVPNEVVDFPDRPARITIGSRTYAVSDVGVPIVSTFAEGEETEEKGARVIDMGGERFRYIWVYEPTSDRFEMYRYSDGEWKVLGAPSDYPQTFQELRAKGHLNEVTPEEMAEFEREMQKRNEETLRGLEEWWEREKSDEQRLVDDATQRYFDERVMPEVQRAFDDVDRGVFPFDFEFRSQLPYDRVHQAKTHALSSALRRHGFYQPYDSAVERYVLRQMGKQFDSDLEDIQSIQWAAGDVAQAAFEKLVPRRQSGVP